MFIRPPHKSIDLERGRRLPFPSIAKTPYPDYHQTQLLQTAFGGRPKTEKEQKQSSNIPFSRKSTLEKTIAALPLLEAAGEYIAKPIANYFLGKAQAKSGTQKTTVEEGEERKLLEAKARIDREAAEQAHRLKLEELEYRRIHGLNPEPIPTKGKGRRRLGQNIGRGLNPQQEMDRQINLILSVERKLPGQIDLDDHLVDMVYTKFPEIEMIGVDSYGNPLPLVLLDEIADSVADDFDFHQPLQGLIGGVIMDRLFALMSEHKRGGSIRKVHRA